MAASITRFPSEKAASGSNQDLGAQDDASPNSTLIASDSTPSTPISESDVSDFASVSEGPHDSPNSSATTLHSEPFAFVKIEQPQAFAAMSVQAAQRSVAPLVRDISVPGAGAVPAQFLFPTLPGNTAHVVIGNPLDASLLRPIALEPGESPKAYFSSLKHQLFERVARAPAERLGIHFQQPVDLHVAVGAPSAPQLDASHTVSIPGALFGASGSVTQTLLTALDQALETRKIRFQHFERFADAPLLLDGISLEDAEAAHASDIFSAAQRLSAAIAEQQSREPYLYSTLRWLTRGSSRFVFSQMLSLGAWFLPRTSQTLEAQVLLAYDKAMRQLRDAKPRATESGETSSKMLSKLYQLSDKVGAIDNGSIDLPSLIPPLQWFGKQPGNLLKLTPSAPLRFEGQFAQGDDDVALGLSSAVTLVQNLPDSLPLVIDASMNASANARGIVNDIALLASTDKAHGATANVNVNAQIGPSGSLTATSRAALSEMNLELTQALNWTPEFADAFIRTWLPEVASLPSTLSAIDAETLRAIGLASLVQAPVDVVAKLASSLSRAHFAVRGIPSDAAHALLTKAPKAGNEPALTSLLVGLPSLQSAAERIAKDLGANSEFTGRVHLRKTNFRLNDSPSKGSLPFSSMLNIDIRPGEYVMRHVPKSQEPQVTAAPV